MRLFLERGFDATTLDDIAASAGVSRRTLFHYFASKEEIVLSTKADFPDQVVAAINRRPADEPLLEMIENAFTDMSAGHQSAQGLALARLIRDTPSLSAGDNAKYERVERALSAALAARKGLPETDVDCRVAAATAVALMKLTLSAWLEGDGDGPEVFGKAAFAALRRITAKT